MKRIATVGVVSHCSALSTVLMERIADMPCAQGEIVEVQPALKNEVVFPITAREIEPYTPDRIAAADFLKPEVYDFNRIRKAKRK